MSERDLIRRIEQLERELRAAQRLLVNVPSQWAVGGVKYTVVVRVSGYTSPSELGGGKYWVKVGRGLNGTFNNSTNLTTANFLFPAANDGILLNLVEAGAFSHEYGANSLVIGWLAGFEGDYKIVVTDALLPRTCP